MQFHENPIVLDLLGVDEPVDFSMGHMEADLASDESDEDAVLDGMLVRQEQEDEVMDLVDFLERADRPMFERDDV
jgi:hypothetical protein